MRPENKMTSKMFIPSVQDSRVEEREMCVMGKLVLILTIHTNKRENCYIVIILIKS